MHQAIATYGNPTTPARSGRNLEYDLLARVTQGLTRAAETHDGNYPALVSALDDNQRLWSTLAVDVAQEGNALPRQLRAQLFYLYQFTAEQTRRVLDGKGNVGVLIDINTAVMRGLRGNEAAP
jgi:flagellar biosynthesis activator protein FlaF